MDNCNSDNDYEMCVVLVAAHGCDYGHGYVLPLFRGGKLNRKIVSEEIIQYYTTLYYLRT